MTKTTDLVTFTEVILNGKLPFFCGGYGYKTLNTKKSKTFRTERSSYKKKASGKCFVKVVYLAVPIAIHDNLLFNVFSNGIFHVGDK